jgi:GTP-binding protein HflX
LFSLWQRNLEDALAAAGGADVKVLDRTAVILEIFAQHAQSREGQLQVRGYCCFCWFWWGWC